MRYRGTTTGLALVAICVLTLTGCTSTDPSNADPSSDGSLSTISDTCVFLAGGTLGDAVDLFGAYTSAPEAVNEVDVSSVVERLQTAQSAADGELQDALDKTVPEFDAMLERYTSGDTLVPIDYQAMSDGLDGALTACGAS